MLGLGHRCAGSDGAFQSVSKTLYRLDELLKHTVIKTPAADQEI